MKKLFYQSSLYLSILLFGLIFIRFTAVDSTIKPVRADTTVTEGDSGSCYTLFLPIMLNNADTDQPVEGGGSEGAIPTLSCSDPDPDTDDQPDVFPDFNGDGYGDLVMGNPNEDIEQGITYLDGGAVHVIYGTENGLVAWSANAVVNDQMWYRGVDGLDDTAVDAYDRFGSAIGLGDFNNDDFDDVAIGVPGSLVDGIEGAGVVQVLYGSADGLTVENTQTWSQGHISIAGQPQDSDGFGQTLAVGDFNNDGNDDLAVGVPEESVGDEEEAGAVNIIYGSANGLTGAGDEILTQDDIDIEGMVAEEDDGFGRTLVAGDFNGDGVDDLAVSSPNEDTSESTANAGSVHIFYGTSGTGLYHSTTGTNAQNIQADSPGIDNLMELGDRFGSTLAAGDFNGDDIDDLAIGTPYETHGGGASAIQNAGAVNIVFGSESGLDTTTSPPIFSQASPGAAGTPIDYELFGRSLTAADFNNDGFDDLAVGVPFEDLGGVLIGAVHIFYSDETGPTTISDELIYDGGLPEHLDRFGYAVTAVDTNGDGYPELVSSAIEDDPQELEVQDVGSVFVFSSNSDGVSQPDFQNWYQGKDGAAGVPEPGDQVGSILP
ncbi:MAG: hypothetical protein AAF490_25835 [Chloroflexota bacterium]